MSNELNDDEVIYADKRGIQGLYPYLEILFMKCFSTMLTASKAF